MKICIYGAGAIGSVLAARLIKGGVHDVSLVARGAHLAAIRDTGLTLAARDQSFTVRCTNAVDDSRLLDPQDIVIVTLKAHSLPDHAGRIGNLLAPDGCALFVTNGIPWWWHYGLPRAYDMPAPRLPLLDPHGALWNGLRERTLGCAVYCAAELTEPGEVRYSGYNRWLIGEPDGTRSDRLETVAAILGDGGFVTEIPADLRWEVWKKLLHNAAYNPVSALTRLTGRDARGDPDINALMGQLVRETGRVAAAMGWNIYDEVESFLTLPVRSGIRPSMLQDIASGRPMEVEAILGQLQAFGQDAGIPTPVLDMLVALARGLNRSLGK